MSDADIISGSGLPDDFSSDCESLTDSSNDYVKPTAISNDYVKPTAIPAPSKPGVSKPKPRSSVSSSVSSSYDWRARQGAAVKLQQMVRRRSNSKGTGTLVRHLHQHRPEAGGCFTRQIGAFATGGAQATREPLVYACASSASSAKHAQARLMSDCIGVRKATTASQMDAASLACIPMSHVY